MSKVTAELVSLDDMVDGTALLDAQISQARAQFAELERRASEGDAIAALIVKRLNKARDEMVAQMESQLFGGKGEWKAP